MKRILSLLLVIFISASITSCIDEKKNDSSAENNASLSGENSNEGASEESLPSFKDVKVGDVIKLGSYEQDNNLSSKEDIEWQVIDIRDGKALIISKDCLDTKKYNDNGDENITWENCSLRAWLNNEFYNTAFSDSAKEIIKSETIKTKDIETTDSIFILSLDEIKSYSTINTRSNASAYAIAKGAFVHPSTPNETYTHWWRRDFDLGTSYVENGNVVRGSYGAGVISYTGQSDSHLYKEYTSTEVAVRPALWIEMK